MKVRPIIYQLLPRLFVNFNEQCVVGGTIEQNGSGKMNAISTKVLKSIKGLGVTHVWYTGVIEHSHTSDYSVYGIGRHNRYITKGAAGSPYAITDYYDIDPDIADSVPDRMSEFESLVLRTHKAGMKVLIDFVPNHVSREYCSDAKPLGVSDFGAADTADAFFRPGNDFYYFPGESFFPSFYIGDGSDAYHECPARASGNDCFTPSPGINDWYETVKLNYGIDYSNGSHHFDPIPPVWYKMQEILLFWASKGVDGFRCDMAFMVPQEFWVWVIPQIKARYPEMIFIAEIYDVSLYRDFIFRCGFDYLYDKVNLYDSLRAIECNGGDASRLTNCWQTVDGIGSNMLNFLENHDEQRFASEYYAGNGDIVLPSLVVTAFMSTGPVMIYAGQELGEKASDSEGFSGYDGRTTIFDYWSIPTVRRWLNSGKCDGKFLTDKEKELRELYRRVLTMCNSEKALREGRFFDLMYVNYDNSTVNCRRQYFFLRHSGETTFLIGVNFDDIACNAEIAVPCHAFEVLGIKEGVKHGVELLSGTKEDFMFSSCSPFTTRIDAHGAVVWKLTKK